MKIADTPSGSEAEGQELGAAGGVTVNQGAEADLVGNPEACQTLDDDSDHDADHGGTAIEQLCPLELIHVDLPLLAVLEVLGVGWGVGH